MNDMNVDKTASFGIVTHPPFTFKYTHINLMCYIVENMRKIYFVHHSSTLKIDTLFFCLFFCLFVCLFPAIPTKKPKQNPRHSNERKRIIWDNTQENRELKIDFNGRRKKKKSLTKHIATMYKNYFTTKISWNDTTFTRNCDRIFRLRWENANP